MMRLVRIALLSVSVLVSCAAYAYTWQPETLKYRVLFKWGLIHKTAGRAVLRLDLGTQPEMMATLTARSEPWADKIYPLRDTLISVMSTATTLPRLYERRAHEDGDYAFDRVVFTRQGRNTLGNTARIRQSKRDAAPKHSSGSLEATGDAVDMVSAFYYIRTLPFESMAPGTARIINIFSGKKKERLRIVFHDRETVTEDGKKWDTYRVTFSFTTDNGKQSSDGITTWLTADSRRIPVKLEGKLKVGRILCLLDSDT